MHRCCPGTPSSIIFRTSLVALTLAAVAAVGCAGTASNLATPAPNASPAPESVAGETAQAADARAQREAQGTWCGYLDALYHRADRSGAQWDKLALCKAANSTAAPKMLKKTADCSMTALKAYAGDPFTPEYAREVSRCGSQALDDLTLTVAELSTYEAAICGRVQACGGDYAECQRRLGTTLGNHLRRALGALNTRGRADLASCVQAAACDNLETQITGCLSPLMDRLLWLPE